MNKPKSDTRTIHRKGPGKVTSKPAKGNAKGRPRGFPIVGIGSSAGGLEATTALLQGLPPQPGMAFVVVPHLDPMHESAYTEILSRATRMPVIEVKDGLVLKPNHVYVIPPNSEMTIADAVLRLNPRVLTRGQHMPIDTFLRSLAEDRGNAAIGVVLSGTATDGTLGLTAIKGEGGITFAQDAGSAKYDGMPMNAVAAGCVDFVLPPPKIAEELARINTHPYIASRERDEDARPRDASYNEIFRMLRRASRVDFSEYKPATIRRRILRRMALNKIVNLKDYVALLHRNREEVMKLYQDILINMTSFFRNPEVFEALKERVYPDLVQNRELNDTIRIWVPGCSSGEEAYSVAISLLEFLEKQRLTIPVQIFGTDLSQAAIHKARTGIYQENIRADVSPQRLHHFFSRVDAGYQISKMIREVCIFSTQNVFGDPPFSRMDLVSCRNVLIYLSPTLQTRVVPIFHYALKSTGFLLLGNAEGLLGAGPDLFELVDRKTKIYRKKPGPSPVLFGTPADHWRPEAEGGEAEMTAPQAKVPAAVQVPSDLLRESDRLLLARYAPPTVIVNQDLEILQTRGHTSDFLELPQGKATLKLLQLARPGLLHELQVAIDDARKDAKEIKRENVHVDIGGKVRPVTMRVIPFKAPLNDRHNFLVVFDDTAESSATAAPPAPVTGIDGSQKDALITQFKQELEATKEYLQSIIEQQEATNEELQSANEEIQSANEELQSTNEELQTSKEELESANEELSTVNEEMQNRNELLTQLNNDLTNLVNSVNIPLVMLGPDLSVRRFTPQAESVLGFHPSDIGRPIGRLKLKLKLNDLENAMLRAVREGAATQHELRDLDERGVLVRITPYRTSEDKIEGLVLTSWNAERRREGGNSGREIRNRKAERRS